MERLVQKWFFFFPFSFFPPTCLKEKGNLLFFPFSSLYDFPSFFRRLLFSNEPNLLFPSCFSFFFFLLYTEMEKSEERRRLQRKTKHKRWKIEDAESREESQSP